MKINTDYRAVTPAYGRDYKNQKEVSLAFLSGADFILQPEGQYCSIRDFESGVVVNIRYAKLMKVLPVTVPVPSMIKYEDKIDPNCGDLMSVKEFKVIVALGGFNEMDGSCCYSNGEKMTKSYQDMYNIPDGVTHIMWFNK